MNSTVWLICTMRSCWRRLHDMNEQLPTADQIENASKNAVESRQVIEASKLAGCFSCAEIFPANEITSWTDNDKTPLCPRCHVDAVLGDSSGYPLNKDSLEMIGKHAFRT